MKRDGCLTAVFALVGLAVSLLIAWVMRPVMRWYVG